MFHGLLSIFSFKLFQCHNIHCKLVLDILTPCLNKCLKYSIYGLADAMMQQAPVQQSLERP